VPPPSDSIRWVRAWALLPAMLCGLAAAAPAAPEPTAVVTILEGDATALQGSVRTAVAEGLRLTPATIVETGPRTALLRIEGNDGTAIDLGPDTRVMLAPPGIGARGSKSPALYLLRGWAKVSGPANTAIYGIVSPSFEMPSQKGVAVAFVSKDEALLFLESGDAQLVERRDGKAQASLALKNTEFYSRQGIDNGKIAARPAPAMLERLPRAFRDTLPRRAAVFQGRNVELKPLAPPSYAELEAWMGGELAIRRPFTRRFLARAREPEFRRALISRLSAHPEWGPILFPPDPDKKKASGPTRGATGVLGDGR